MSARLVVGLQPVRELLRANAASIERVLVERGDSPVLAAVARFARDRGAAVEIADRGALDRMTRGAKHQGVLALAAPLALTHLDDLAIDDASIVVALDEIQDPQNFGATVRSAVALGGAAILWPENGSAPLSPATFRASAGAIEHATLCRVPSLPSALASLAARGARVVGLDMSGEVVLEDVDLTGPLVVVIGSEGEGLRRGVRKACSVVARLPMAGPIASLNASVAGALALYEVGRQRRAAGAKKVQR